MQKSRWKNIKISNLKPQNGHIKEDKYTQITNNNKNKKSITLRRKQ